MDTAAALNIVSIDSRSMMEETINTRNFVERTFGEISKNGFGSSFLDKLSEDVVWTANGTSPRGYYEGKSAYKGKILDRLHERIAGFGQPYVDRILADGQWAAVNFHTVGARAHNGLDFSMEYCWLLKVEDEKIVEVVGFCDSKKMCDLFA